MTNPAEGVYGSIYSSFKTTMPFSRRVRSICSQLATKIGNLAKFVFCTIIVVALMKTNPICFLVGFFATAASSTGLMGPSEPPHPMQRFVNKIDELWTRSSLAIKILTVVVGAFVWPQTTIFLAPYAAAKLFIYVESTQREELNHHEHEPFRFQ